MKRQSLTRHAPILAAALAAFAAAPALASSMTAPFSQAGFQGVNKGATYTGNWAVGFSDGPITIGSGEITGIFAGPGIDRIDGFLITLAVDPAASFLAPIELSLFAPDSTPVGTTSFDTAAFIPVAAAGFPRRIPGIGNGEVNGIKFPSSRVAGVEVILDGLDSANNGDLLAGLGITSLTPVRVDLFGLAINSPGTIVSGGPNSHALGVQPIPEPGATVSFLSGFLVVGLALRQHAHTGR